jgi:archaellum biogenesis ATPase FlaH
MVGFIKTHFEEYDHELEGIKRGTVTMIKTQTCAGKTTMAQNLAYNVSVEDNLNVCFVCLEHRKTDVYSRLYNIHTSKNMFKPDVVSNIRDKIEVLDYTDIKRGERAEDSFFSNFVGKKFDLIIIDTINLLDADEYSIIRRLREYCIKKNCAAVVLGQLNRVEHKAAEDINSLTEEEQVKVFWKNMSSSPSSNLCEVVMTGIRHSNINKETTLRLTPRYIRYKNIYNSVDINLSSLFTLCK